MYEVEPTAMGKGSRSVLCTEVVLFSEGLLFEVLATVFWGVQSQLSLDDGLSDGLIVNG